MSKPLDLKKPQPLFRLAHYTWLADYAKRWNTAAQLDFAAALYADNTNFKPLRWFQRIGYDRGEAERMYDVVMRRFT